MKKPFILLLLTIWSACFVMAQTEMRLMRFPAIHGNQVVFTYAGDLYTVDAQGGLARKLTNDLKGYEMFPRFSPDGKSIAFTGQYDGNTEVYLMPADGGIPKRLTYTATLGRDDISDRMGPNNIVMTWRDDKSIVYRSRKQSFNDFKGQLFVASVNGGLSEELPLPAGGFCSYSPDGSKMAYNRVFREFRTWKYYKGGMADDIWIYDFASKTVENITNTVNQDIFPMWKGDVVYYLSDRDRTMNLFCYNTKTRATEKLTNYTEYDIKWPSLGDKAIIYENGGYLYTFDLATRKIQKVSVTISEDFASGRSVWKDASQRINTYDVSPDGNRGVFGARGDVFTVPAKTGITRNLTESNGAHDRDVAWSPNGKYIAYISDRNGEDEIYIQKPDGSEAAIQLTNTADAYKYSLMWSPDSKKILWSDRLQRLQYIDIDTKAITLVEKTTEGELRDFNWAPDNNWIVYTMPVRNSSSRIMVYNLSTKEKNFITDTWYDAGGASFSPDGKFLYFTSSRDFNPTYSWTEWNHVYTDMSKVYLVPLLKATASPFAPENNEASIKQDEPEKATADKGKKDKKDKKDESATADKGVVVKIDFDGIEGRSIALPIEAAAYWNVFPREGGTYYVRGGKSGTALCWFSLDDKKETNLGEYGNFALSADGKKMMLPARGKYAIIDAPKGKINIDESMDLGNMKVKVDLQKEWKQIYDESWRQMRDFFYDPNMHGVNWKAMHDKYAALLPFVNNRNDLNYLIGELNGELSVGHAYVGGGDKPQPERIQTGLLGAKLNRDASGYYKIEKILKGENWNPSLRSPLTESGVDAQVGDYIIAVNGKSTKDMIDIYEYLLNTAGKQVELSLNKTASLDGSRKVLVLPVADEASLYYYNWVQDNIAKVDKATNGQVGYIHIPDMGVEGLNEFVKYYYPQLNKRALIIDDRGNGGGNVSPMIIERLRRELATFSVMRNGAVSTRPNAMLWGPKVLMLDNYSASDGDLFPFQFKFHKIGKTIGMRSWGGVVGIRGSLPLIDGGILNKPEFGPFDVQGKEFIIEGHGVDPDIVVDNDPAKEYAGEDQQLNKAIETILDELKAWPTEWPKVPAFPDKSK